MEENFNQNEAPQTSLRTPSTNIPQPEVSQQTVNNEKKPIGPVIGIAVIVVIIIFGGLYYWGSKLNTNESVIIDPTDAPTAEEIINQEDTVLEQLQTQSSSDEIKDIEADLSLTDLENLDAGLENIDAELGL